MFNLIDGPNYNTKNKKSPLPVYHADPFKVDKGFADLQAEQHQSYI